MKLAAISFGVALLVTPALAPADYYSYTTESGTLAYTDDFKRVPARYQDRAEKRPERSLADYARLTVVPNGATFAPSPELLVIPNDEESNTTVAYVPAKGGVKIDAGAGVLLDVPNAEAGPVQLSRRLVWKHGVSTRQLVVRQAGETLAVIDLGGFQEE